MDLLDGCSSRGLLIPVSYLGGRATTEVEWLIHGPILLLHKDGYPKYERDMSRKIHFPKFQPCRLEAAKRLVRQIHQ